MDTYIQPFKDKEETQPKQLELPLPVPDPYIIPLEDDKPFERIHALTNDFEVSFVV